MKGPMMKGGRKGFRGPQLCHYKSVSNTMKPITIIY